MKKKSYFIFSIITIIFILISYEQAMCITSELTVEKNISISEKVINKDYGYLIESIRMPVINSDNKLNANKINGIIENDVLNRIKEAENTSEQYFGKTKEKPAYPYKISYDYKILSNTYDLLSICAEYYEYLGGAHGSTSRFCYTIDKKNLKIIQIKDLFKNEYDYKEIINKEIRHQIDERIKSGEYFFFSKGSDFKGINENQNYYLENNNLIIYFQEYELAPYAAGIIEFKIPVKLFQGNYIY